MLFGTTKRIVLVGGSASDSKIKDTTEQETVYTAVSRKDTRQYRKDLWVILVTVA